MKKNKLLLAILSFTLVTTGVTLSSCGNSNSTQGEAVFVDYVNQLKFDANSGRKYAETTVYKYIDGDTTHFNIDDVEGGIYKARYLGVDTPESTGKIEPWGKKASLFTHSRLENAQKILIESSTDKWEVDSTGSRYLTWVWYMPSNSNDYRLLNLELVQEGYSMLKNSAATAYGEYFTKAYNQALNNKLRVAANQKDPDYFYGGPIEVSIAELVLHTEEYATKGTSDTPGITTKVRFNGLITKVDAQTIYVEDYDSETDAVYGMELYTGFNFSGEALMKVGNYISWCGTYSYSSVSSSYQVSDFKYYEMIESPENIKLIEIRDVVPTEITGADFTGTKTIEFYDEETEKKYEKVYNNADLLLSTNVKVSNLKVNSISTTISENKNSNGAMTLKCTDASGNNVTIRTSVLYDENNQLVTASYFEGKTIDATGIVDQYVYSEGDASTQIHVFSLKDIVIK